MTAHPLPATRCAIRLADGRALIYYDEQPGHDHAAVDQRNITPAGGASEIRWDPLNDEWVIIAAHRQERTYLPPA
jgi:UDPglucose--hexose-1-phosphate uridylyltransferase